ncbi:MAG: hypothetical protein INR70_02140 [Parafilimonas terrae]|nr:hypothetical protein [Parafilimonas terrae]
MFALASALALGGCIRPVTIPVQMTALKEACHGKDRPMAGVATYSVWRCGEGDQPKYAIYKGDALVKESNELEAAQAATGFTCIGRGLKMGTPEFATCSSNVGQVALAATSNLRDRENVEAEIRRQRAADALVAAGTALQASAQQAQAAMPAPTFAAPVAPVMQAPVSCTSRVVFNTVRTNCN